MSLMTRQKFKERLTKHIADIKLKQCRTAICKLNQEQEIMINFKEVKIIKKLSSNQKLIIME